MTSHYIRVHVHLPVTVPTTVSEPLCLDPENWTWTHLLTFPVLELNRLQFSLRPYKWIRFVAGIIISARGDLSPDRVNPTSLPSWNSNWEGELPDQSLDLYYHTSNEEKSQMLPIDTHIDNERISVTHSSLQDPEFGRSLAERDQEHCVLTGDPCECEAAHVIPFRMGDEV